VPDRKVGDVAEFVPDVIELEHEDVGLTAVDARRSREPIPEKAPKPECPFTSAPPLLRALLRRHPRIPLGRMRPMAVAAPRLQRSARLPP
jgi:hypothetical protein